MFIPTEIATDGYWGTVTSTLDWCEDNYAISYYIAEFWNTLTNVAFIVPCLFGAYSSWANKLERRFVLAYLSEVVIGIGSALFHATLKRTSQLLDEIPMLFATSIFLFIVVEIASKGSASSRWGGILFFISAASSLVYIMTRNSAVFFFVYTVMMLFLTGLCFVSVRQHPLSWRLGRISFTTYLIGFILWNFENNFCGIVQSVRHEMGPGFGVVTQLHAWWHTLAAVGGYYLVIFLAQLRASASKTGYKIVYLWEIVPVIERDMPQVQLV